MAIRSIFSRQSGCVECQDGSPSCPSCASNEQCQVIVPLDCTSCPQASCVASSTSTTSTSKSTSKVSTGAIAGGVVGGVVLVAAVIVAVYFVWKHKIKNKRGEFGGGAWDAETYSDSQREKDPHSRRQTQASSNGRNSIASTVLTRASNIIQIAYIPGVTNRATPTSPTLLVPPVPPIPIARSGSQAGTPNSTEDQHFFVPGDLRDSVCSGVSGYTDRTSYARTSYAPRSSVASTVYGKAGVVVTPAQTGMRAKAAMVSVKSIGGNSTGSEGSTPPVPALDLKRFADPSPASPADSTFSVGSTFLNNATSANTATAVRAQMVSVGSSLKQSSTIGSTSDDEQPTPKTPMFTSPLKEEQSPFRDPPEPKRSSSQTLSAVIEEATKRASQRPSTADRAKSPFGDEHATHDDK